MLVDGSSHLLPNKKLEKKKKKKKNIYDTLKRSCKSLCAYYISIKKIANQMFGYRLYLDI